MTSSKECHKLWRERNREKINAKGRESYKQNREKILEQKKKWYEKNKESNKIKHREYKKKNDIKLTTTVIEHYGGTPPKCACCGETERTFLVLDHINGNGTKQRKKLGTGHAVFRWIVKNGFPDEYQVLCSNCNLSKMRNKGQCAHKL